MRKEDYCPVIDRRIVRLLVMMGVALVVAFGGWLLGVW